MTVQANKYNRLKGLSGFLLVILLLALIFSFPACWKALILGGTIQKLSLIDGLYEGEASHGPNKAVVRITIEDSRITEIEILQNWGLRAKRTVPIIPDRIIALQSTEVDAVTGATNSSRVLMNAVYDAVLKAVRR